MTTWRTLDGTEPRVIAHRGASGLRPEHTLAAYALAIEQGCDLIEPDLVPSRDGVLMARHERELSRSTDVAQRPDWASRAGTMPGERRWWTEDYDHAALASLCAVQPFAGRSPAFDGQFAIPRFDEVVALARERWRTGHALGVYPEIKDPSALLAKGIDATSLLIDALRSEDLGGAASPVWVQCFELEPLRRVHAACANPVFALFERIDVASLRALCRSDEHLSGIAVSKSGLFDAAGASLVECAHAAGWQVHAWTLRDDAVSTGFADVDAEYRALFDLGVDAMFCDFPASALSARRRWVSGRS